MKILVVSDHLHQGGAAIACNRLCDALAVQPGIEVQRFYLNPCATPGRLAFPCTPGSGRRTENLLQLLETAKTTGVASALRRRIAASRLGRTLDRFQPDVVNLHNLHGFVFPIPHLARLIGARPLIWTLHDMWSFTGRCAYAYDCAKFLTGCDAACPTPGEYPALPPAAIAPAWAEKRAFLHGRPHTAAACPSAWLANEAGRGFWAGSPVENIPNGLPLDVFFPVDKHSARAALGLPQDGILSLMAADYLVERRKGGDIIGQALALAARPDAGLMTMGHARGLTIEGLKIHPLGYVSDDAVKRLVYSAADLLIHPAPVDNLPNTVVEALACGTPTAAFRTGGLPEMVVPGETGWLCDRPGAAPFAECLRTAFGDIAAGINFSDSCRRRAERHHSPTGMAQAYLRLCQRVST